MKGKVPTLRTHRVVERRRAVALARHYREFEGLSIRQIADRLGRSPATVKAYFYDSTGEKAKAVKARYVGVCRGCGAYTQPRNGKGDAYAYGKACHPGAIERRWTRERVVDAMLEWRRRYGRLQSSYDWSRTHACRRGGEALKRLAEGDWPAATVVSRVFGAWAVASAAAGGNDWEEPTTRATLTALGSNSISLPKPRESTAKTEDPRGDQRGLLPVRSLCGLCDLSCDREFDPVPTRRTSARVAGAHQPSDRVEPKGAVNCGRRR